MSIGGRKLPAGLGCGLECWRFLAALVDIVCFNAVEIPLEFGPRGIDSGQAGGFFGYPIGWLCPSSPILDGLLDQLPDHVGHAAVLIQR